MSAAVTDGEGHTLHAVRLRCLNLVDPIGIDVSAPTFSWVPEASGPQRQAAYQLLISSTPGGRGDVWDSGQVSGDDCVGVVHGGGPLRPRRRYWWTVRLWGVDGRPGPYARPRFFETGLLTGDWFAQWISGTRIPLLRREFDIAGDVRRARAYVAALGYYELRLNGERVGDRVLDPPTTAHEHDPDLTDGHGKPVRMASARTLYSTYDVTDLLRSGANAAGLVLGHGWYSAEEDIGSGPLPRKPYGERPRVMLQIEIETATGDTSVVVTDRTWSTAPAPITYNDYAQGERYDARRESIGWDRPGFKDAWEPATVAPAPDSVVRAQPMEPARVVQTLAPVRTTRTRDGHLLVDFGQHFSGWTRITVAGPAGAVVSLRHAGERTPEGELDDDANMGAWLPARQTDTYTLKGDGEEMWEPRFTLHGFRFVEVSVSDPDVVVLSAEGRVVHSDLERAGEFECSEPLLNRLHRNVVWTFRSSFQGFPQDAAERYERVGWVGDPGWSIGDYLYVFESRGFWLKWLDDLADGQLPDGAFPLICPPHWRGRMAMEAPDDYDVPEDFETVIHWPYASTPDFAMTSHPSIAWNLYAFYGDRSILRRHYPAMRRGVEFLLSQANALIIEEGLGDHMEPQPDGTSSVFAKRTPVALTSTAWFHAVTTMTGNAAEVLGLADDAAHHRELADRIRTAFNERFYDAQTASYGEGSQTAPAIALWFGLVPDDQRERVLRGLVTQIMERDGGHLSTGTMGTAALQHVLPAAGQADVMLEIATRTTFPGWGYQIAQDATTIWETWGGDRSFSRNMKLMAMIEKFLFNDVAGLAPAAPGWRRILVHPRLTHRLASARARVSTPLGEAAVDWRAEGDRLDLDLRVPATSVAEVRLPARGRPRVNGQVWEHVPVVDEHLVLELPGGLHHVRITAEGDRA